LRLKVAALETIQVRVRCFSPAPLNFYHDFAPEIISAEIYFILRDLRLEALLCGGEIKNGFFTKVLEHFTFKLRIPNSKKN